MATQLHQRRRTVKPGPPPKVAEPRPTTTIRPPQSLRDQCRSAAEQAGAESLNDYIVYVLARAQGLPIPEYLGYLDRSIRERKHEIYLQDGLFSEMPAASGL